MAQGDDFVSWAAIMGPTGKVDLHAHIQCHVTRGNVWLDLGQTMGMTLGEYIVVSFDIFCYHPYPFYIRNKEGHL